jgi:hypothetical protein
MIATSSDLAARWRDLTPVEENRASVLLGSAERKVTRLWPDVLDRIDSGDLDRDDVVDVLAAMVQRVMTRPSDGVVSRTDTRGPFSETVRYQNPDGGLYLTSEEKAVFGGSEGAATARSVWLC